MTDHLILNRFRHKNSGNRCGNINIKCSKDKVHINGILKSLDQDKSENKEIWYDYDETTFYNRLSNVYSTPKH